MYQSDKMYLYAAIIETKALTHIYSAGTPFEHTALDSVDFCAYPGEYLGIIGHTGSGKSTLIQHLNALLKPTAGTVLFQDTDIWSDPKITKKTRFQVGLVFQYPEYQLFEETVTRTSPSVPKTWGWTRRRSTAGCGRRPTLWACGTISWKNPPLSCPGGQKRRVAIAGVIAMEPKVLILDEPTAGLDPEGVESILGNIREYHQAHNATIILVSHSMEEVEVARSVDRLVAVNDGKIPFQGPPREVFQHGDELKMGLGVPQLTTRVFHRLKALGVDIDPSVYTLDQAKAAVLEKLKKGVG